MSDADGRAWRIDTLDMRGGLAFASWRAANLFEGDRLEDAPVYHFSPPTFAPSPVASRALALAAERHGFQLGLLDQDGEIPFTSLADISEFLRRGYASTGRDDPGGGMTSAPPPPEGEPPRGPLFVEPPETRPLAPALARFEKEVKSLLRGRSAASSWDDAEIGSPTPASGLPAAVRGALILLAELLGRRPPEYDEVGRERWRGAGRRLLGSCLRMGLLDWLFRPEGAQPLALCCRDVLQAEFPAYAEYEPVQMAGFCLGLLLEDAPDAFWPKHAGDWWWRRLSATTAEPLADLREMPIPGRVGSLIGAAPADRATAANLLAAVLAAPGSLVHRDVEAVFLFAAARVVAFPGSDFTCEAAPIDWNVWRDRDKALAQAIGLSRRGLAWATANLPRRAFSAPVEEMIRVGPTKAAPVEVYA